MVELNRAQEHVSEPGTDPTRQQIVRILHKHRLRSLRPLIVIAAFCCIYLVFGVAQTPFKLVRGLIPSRSLRNRIHRLMERISDAWVGCCRLALRWFTDIEWQFTGKENLERDRSYLMICNHRSWADSPAGQQACYPEAPSPKYLVKRQLRFVPFVGFMCWAMDMPFLNRYPRTVLEADPAKRLEDLEIIRNACKIFRHVPVTVGNFAEGTRFTPEKRDRKGSPYRHLLMPKASGAAVTLRALEGQITRVMDLTVAYPDTENIWDLLCAKRARIRIHIEVIPVTPDLIGDYYGDPEFREHFQSWLNKLWEEKDARLDRWLNEADAGA